MKQPAGVGVPSVRGVPATWDESFDPNDITGQVGFCGWKCPHCGARLSNKLICLNGCGLTPAALDRMAQFFRTQS